MAQHADAPTSLYPIVLDPDERGALQALARRPTTAYRLVLRARIVLAAAGGAMNTAIAARHGVHVDTVRKWRRRFFARRLEGLADAGRDPRAVTFRRGAQPSAHRSENAEAFCHHGYRPADRDLLHSETGVHGCPAAVGLRAICCVARRAANAIRFALLGM